MRQAGGNSYGRDGECNKHYDMMDMAELDKKLRDERRSWEIEYPRLMKERQQRFAWLESEVSFISGLIHRASGRRPQAGDRVLQVGAGPLDVIHFWDAAERHAIDPLADYYRGKFTEFNAFEVNYVTGVGEKLPYADGFFDIVILRNTLDHVYDPAQTLREARRVLKSGGAVYLWIYLYTRRSSWAYRAYNYFTRAFESEPWAFTLGRIRRLLAQEGFEVRYPAIEARPVEKKDCPGIFSKRFGKEVVKALLHFYRDQGWYGVAVTNK